MNNSNSYCIHGCHWYYLKHLFLVSIITFIITFIIIVEIFLFDCRYVIHWLYSLNSNKNYNKKKWINNKYAFLLIYIISISILIYSILHSACASEYSGCWMESRCGWQRKEKWNLMTSQIFSHQILVPTIRFQNPKPNS